MDNVIKTDVLIIGSGLAGLIAAIKLRQAGADVVVACKTSLLDSTSSYAQGGVAAAPGDEVAPVKLHFEDTIKAGAELVNERVAREVIDSAWQLIQTLAEYGVAFDCHPDGSYSLAREGGHSTARVYHHQDVTGHWICRALVDKLTAGSPAPKGQALGSLHIYEHAFASQLLIVDGICCGARFVENKLAEREKSIQASEFKTVWAKHTILATGGIGQVYSRTTNPLIATGDGIALAYQAGAELIDMEFVQFHPTALYLPELADRPALLISEAVRGAGAVLLDHNMQQFMQRFHPSGELATRDVISRAMHTVMHETGAKELFLDLRPIGKERLIKDFPNIMEKLNQYGINALEQAVPISPAAHYFMGGIRTDCNGSTSIPALYAIGECASTGLHGANRLASNSLLEAGVMALKVAELINKDVEAGHASASFKQTHSSDMPLLVVPTDQHEVRHHMFMKVGVIREAMALNEVLKKLEENSVSASYSVSLAEASNILLIAKLIAASALRREESRGAHFRVDFPQLRKEFAVRQVVSQTGYSWIGVNEPALLPETQLPTANK